MPAINDAKAFGRKLAFTVPPAAGPPQIVAPKTPKPPVIGERKALPQPPPASMDAISASKSMRPSPKTASAVTAMVPKPGVKRAPSYTKQGRKGKKVMPMPHNKQNKKASAADFGRMLGQACRVKQAMVELGATGPAATSNALPPQPSPSPQTNKLLAILAAMGKGPSGLPPGMLGGAPAAADTDAVQFAAP